MQRSDDNDVRAQLAELTRQARAYVEWVADSGVAELPTQGSPDALLAGLNAPSPQPRGRAQGRGTQGGGAQRRGAQGRGPQGRGAQSQQPRQQGGRPPAQFQAPRQDQAPSRGQASQGQASRRRSVAVGQGQQSSLIPAREYARPKTAEERKQRLAVLAEEVANCTKCRLHESRTKTAFSRGNHETELVLVGEGPGYNEDQQGLPFVGKAGQLLDRMVAAMGYQRDDVYICNIVKCRPPKNRKPEPDEMRACLPYLEEQLAIIDPKAIVTLGATGAQGLLNTTMGVTRMRGTWKLYRGRIPLMPTFHPAYLLRQPAKKREVWQDLQAVMKNLGKPLPAKKKKKS